ncbi:MAG: DUF4845 domain-containing protein [Gammaproteobacteria bacterium]|nr:DUF4845 domain-containing protein [Gammaproteobacteria bacterium]
MKPLRAQQQGITLGGLMIVLAFIAVLVTFVVRAFPLYNEKMQIVSAMNSIASNPEAAGMSDGEIQRAFLRNIEATTNIQRFNDRNIKDYAKVIKPTSKGDPKMFQVTYQSTNVLFSDLNLMMDFNQQVALQGNAGG